MSSKYPHLDAAVNEIYFRLEYRFKEDIIYERIMHALRDFFREQLNREVNMDYGHWDDCDIKIGITPEEAQFIENKLCQK